MKLEVRAKIRLKIVQYNNVIKLVSIEVLSSNSNLKTKKGIITS